jgi:hypothetical protein
VFVCGCSLVRYPDGRYGMLGPSATRWNGDNLKRAGGLKKSITRAAVARYAEVAGELAGAGGRVETLTRGGRQPARSQYFRVPKMEPQVTGEGGGGIEV